MSKKILVAVITLLVLAGLLFASPVLAKKGDERPGWGYGDANHIHTGPPGQTNGLGGPGPIDNR